MVNLKPLTKAELKKYFNEYRDAFPDWFVKHQMLLARRTGPIEQHIYFQSLRWGAYRPSCSIHVDGPGIGFQLLNRMLDVKHREVRPIEHVKKFPLVLEAMQQQFVPSVQKPLDVEEVARLAEQDVIDGRAGKIPYLLAIMILCAYLKNYDRALYWHERVESNLVSQPYARPDYEMRHVQLSRQLNEAIRSGNPEPLLASIFSSQR